MSYEFRLLCICLLSICTLGHSQITPIADRTDTVTSISTTNSPLFSPDSLLEKETFLKKRYSPQLREYIFYKRLKNNASKSNFTNFLHSWLVKSSSETFSNNDPTSARFEKYNGKIIRNIDIQQIVVFGPTVDSPTQKAKSVIEKSGNIIQRNTKKRIIQNLIFVNSGDIFESENAKDNERIIRSQTFIYDCKIKCVDVPQDSNLVDLVFLTQDAFSYGLEAHGALNRQEFGIYNNNHLGIGNKLYLAMAHSTNSNELTWGPDIQYTIRNINSNFINLKLRARETYADQTFSIDLEKEFVTNETRYAGKSSIKRVRGAHKIYDTDPREYESDIDYDCINLWMGRSFLISKSTTGLQPNNFIVASKISRYAFFNRDSILDNYNIDNFWFWLSEFNLAKSNYKKSKLLYGFGRTEDIPYGYSIKVLGGNKWTKSTSTPYIGASLSGATKVSEKTGYFNGETQIGGFIKDNQFTEGVLRGKIEYITPLIRLRYTLSRHSFAAYYIKGFNRQVGDSLYLSTGDLTIEAFESNTINGIQKLIFSYENTVFLRRRHLGFRVAFFSFFDYGGVGIKRPLEQDYMAFGAGIKFRNDNLIFNTLQIRFAFTPNHPPNMNYTNFRISDEYNRGINGFRQIGITPFAFQ